MVAAGMHPVQVEAVGAVGDAQVTDTCVKDPATLAGRHPASVQLAGALVAPGMAGDSGRTRIDTTESHEPPPQSRPPSCELP